MKRKAVGRSVSELAKEQSLGFNERAVIRSFQSAASDRYKHWRIGDYNGGYDSRRCDSHYRDGI